MAAWPAEHGLRRLPAPPRPRPAPSRAVAFARAARLFDAGCFFEACQHLDHVWTYHAEPGDRDFWKAVTQVAAGCVHAQRGNAVGARTLLGRAAAALSTTASPHQGVDVDRLVAAVRELEGQVAHRGASADLDFPRLPRAQ